MNTRIRSGDRVGHGLVLRRLSVGLLFAVALLAVGCSAAATQAGGSDAVETSEVRVDDDVFEPETVDVAAGTEVTWTWVGDNAHNVTADEFSSDTQEAGTFSHTFDQPGTYSYECTLHSVMAGTVTVTDAADGGAT